MKNKNVGFLIIGISILVGFIVWLFNRTLKNIVSSTCVHGPACSMYSSISVQTWISLAIVALIFVIGLFFVFSKETEKIVVKKIRLNEKTNEKAKKERVNASLLKELSNEERKIMHLILENNGTIFQSEIVEKTGFSKVKVTRLLDKLEGKQLIERRRRGMTNVVILK